MPAVPDPTSFWETVQPWLKGGALAGSAGLGVAIKWAYGAWHDRGKDKHAAHLSDEEVALKERAQWLAEQEIFRKGAREAAADAISEANRVSIKLAAVQASADRWSDIARAWRDKAYDLKHWRDNERQIIEGLYRMAVTVRPDLPAVEMRPNPQLPALERVLDPQAPPSV